MADEIIDLTRYLSREGERDVTRDAVSLWGADGERSRFALPLWRIIYLAQADRGVIVWRSTAGGEPPVPFVALDLAHEPARTALSFDLPVQAENDVPALYDRGSEGLVVYLGAREGRAWSLVVDGSEGRAAELGAQAREDILFLAGECAGLLFSRDLADHSKS
jgi:hypothetical protein